MGASGFINGIMKQTKASLKKIECLCSSKYRKVVFTRRRIMAIALTGATSMIGIALITQCILNNIRVYALVRPGSSRLSRIPQSNLVSVLVCDLDNLANFNPVDINHDADVFYHIGWADTDKQGRNSCSKQLQNIQYTLDAVHLAKKIGCKKFIGAGSQAEYGLVDVPLNDVIPVNPEIAYGVAKYAAGKFAKIECEYLNLTFNWVRIVSVYGINDNHDALIKLFMKNCRTNISMPLGPCTHMWDYLFEDDAGRAMLAIGQKGIDGKIYCLGSGIGKPLKEYLEVIKNIINPSCIPEYGVMPYTEKSVRYLCADISELTADTKWKPEVSFEKGIRKIIDYKA
jgi:nucleoside-diphosphate-sugar epimerase